MPYANNNGVKIYYEVEGKGPPLVLAHALGGDGMYMWRRDKHVKALKNDFRLILLGFRGHGRDLTLPHIKEFLAEVSKPQERNKEE